MQIISQRLKMLKKKIKRELHIPDRPFLELVALHLFDVLTGLLLILAMFAFFEVFYLFSANSLEEARQVSIFFATSNFSLTGVSFVFCLVSGWRIIPELEKFDSLTKYNFLMIRPFLLNAMVFSLFFMLFFLPLTLSGEFLTQAIGNLLFWKIQYFYMGFIIGLGGIIVGFTFLSISDERETAMNFALFEDFEVIGERYNRQIGVSESQARVLKSLMKRIVYKTEKAVNRCLDVCKDFPTEFYRPFTRISLTAILGNTKQNEKAKAWVSELGNIVMEKRIGDTAKSKLILEHLEKVENDQSLNDFRKIQDTFGFQYSFEHGRKRLSKTWERIIVAISGIATIALFIKAILGF